jgi:hypothetical protein
MAHNSIGNIPHPNILSAVLFTGESFNMTREGIRLDSATLWGRPGGENPYGARSQLNRACLSDGDRETLADARYVIFSSFTPIAWQLRDGRWMVPAHQYSDLTCQQTVAVLGALSYNDVRPENGNLLQP